jgi:hypothetical protein
VRKLAEAKANKLKKTPEPLATLPKPAGKYSLREEMRLTENKAMYQAIQVGAM